MVLNGSREKKTRKEFLKDVARCFEQILEEAPYKSSAVRPFTTHRGKGKQDMLYTASEVKTTW